MADPIVTAAAIGVVVAPVAGRALLRGFESMPERWHRGAAWLLVGGVVAIAALTTLSSDGAMKEGAFILLLGALPGIIAFIAFQTALASAVVSLVPLYFGIGVMTLGRPLHTLETIVDRLVPLRPEWMLVYASMYVFVLLPLLVVRDRRLFYRALQSYVFVLTAAYVGFIVYPTIAPRPAAIIGDGFAAWCLRLQYSLDWQYNCFPSLHVAHSFVSALTCYRVNRNVGAIAAVWAVLIGVSTMYTKQHYFVDVIGGIAIALMAYAIFLRRYPRELVAERDRQLAPQRSLRVAAIFAVLVTACWIAYRASGASLSAQELARQPATASVDAFAAIQTLSADLLRSRSATATLETWCREHRLADTPRIVARVVSNVSKAPSAEQLRRLDVTTARDVRYRRVRLQCGTHVLSEADNWYVPAALTAEMNRLLDTTDTPFGRVVAPLEPYRETLGIRLFWSDSTRPVPDALFEHHAVLYTKDHRPFSEVAELYRRDLLDAPSSAAAAGAGRDVRSARIAQNQAIAAGDLDRAAAFWTDDVTVRRALGQSVTGRAAAREALQPPPPASRIVYQRVTSDVDVSTAWPLAFETGTWEGHLGTVTGPPIVGGRFSAQWVQRGDRWLIRSEVFVALTCSGLGCQSAAVP